MATRIASASVPIMASLLAIAGPAWPALAAQPTDPDVDRIVEEMEAAASQRRDAQSNTRPITEAVPTPDQKPTLLAEGSFLRGTVGGLYRSELGDWVFITNPNDPDDDTPPMALLPCSYRQSMEAIAERLGDDAIFSVSGAVFLYRGRNYLLPRNPPTLTQALDRDQPERDNAEQPPRPASSDAAVEGVLDDLEQATRQRRPGPRVQAPPRQVGSPTGRLLNEGSFIRAEQGRMIRSGTGEWVFTQDNDADGNEKPPLILMPCLNLQSMESTAQRLGESATFTVSGEVYVFMGKNYLLPGLYVVNRPSSNLSSAQ